MTRVLVCGGRDYTDVGMVFTKLSEYDSDYHFAVLIEGDAQGADRIARLWANMNKLPILTFEAYWQKHGRAAGPIRNERMLTEGKPDLVIAFPGGRGTADMVSRARARGVEVIEGRS